MARTYAVMADEDAHDGQESFGEHDPSDELEGVEVEPKPHWHWSILAIEDGIVVDLDWGYHSAEEAQGYIQNHPFYTGAQQ